MSRVHELSKLTRTDLITLFLDRYDHGNQIQNSTDVAVMTRDQLIAAIVTHEEHQAERGGTVHAE